MGVPARTANRYSARNTLLAGTILSGALLLTPALVAAQVLPTGGEIVAGSAVIDQSGSTTTIRQSSRNAVINWKDFSIGQARSVVFDNGTGATLNRVTGQTVTEINGHLSATGSAYVINPNGIIIGADGVIDVGGTFVAATLDVDNDSFMSGGPLAFSGDSKASVINLGHVGALGGDVALIASKIQNFGTIEAAKGNAGLLAGYRVLLNDSTLDGGRFTVDVGGADTVIETRGRIKAAAVELKAENGNIYALAGRIEAHGRSNQIETVDGRVMVRGANSDLADLPAAVTAAVTETVAETGPVQGAGGSIVIAGGSITVGRETVLDASAGDVGKGGKIAVIASDDLIFKGTALAKGGSLGGDGGWIETSGHKTVDFAGAIIDASAPAGQGGEWLIDPYDLTVDSAAASTINTSLNSGTSVTLLTTATSSSGPGTPNSSGLGDITINAPISWNSAAGLTLNAYRSVIFNADVTTSGGDVFITTANGGDYKFNNGSSITFGTSNADKLTQSITINSNPHTLIYSNSELDNLDGFNAITRTGTSTGVSGRFALATNFNAAGSTFQNALFGLDSSSKVFSGTLTGLGHKIQNLTIANPTGEAGLIGYSSTAAILRDIHLVDASVSGATWVGGLTGYSSGTVKNVSVTGTFVGTGTDSNASTVGGVLGRNFGNLSNAAMNGTVRGVVALGGLVGSNFKDISDSYASAAVTGSASGTKPPSSIGGLVGWNSTSTTITRSYATGSVRGNAQTGGLVGTNNGAISDSYSSTSVIGTGPTGGLVGQLQSSGTITRSYAMGRVSGSGSVGGLVGSSGAAAANITSSYWNPATTGQTTSAAGSSLTTAQFQNGALPTGFTAAAWGVGSGLYPYLTGFGTVTTARKLSGLASNSNGTAAPGARIDLYSGGSLLGWTTSGADGSYYFVKQGGTFTAPTRLAGKLTLVTETTPEGGLYSDDATMLFGGGSGFNIKAGFYKSFTSDTTFSAFFANVGATFDGQFNTNLTDIQIYASGAFTVDAAYTLSRRITIEARGGDLTIGVNGALAANAEAQDIILATNGAFRNYSNVGAGALSANYGRWLISTTTSQANAADDVAGGLAGKNYYGIGYTMGTGFAGTVGSGNRFVHSYRPTLTVTADTKSVEYNGAVQTDSHALLGYLAGDQAADTLSGTYGSSPTSSKNVGSYTVTPTGTLVSEMNYAIAYASGTLTITEAPLRLQATTDTKTYDATWNSSGLVTITGLKGTDTASATQYFDSANASTPDGRTLFVDSNYTVNDGNSGRNYTVQRVFTSGTINRAALTLTASTDTKTYDGTTSSTGSVTVSGLQGVDSISGTSQSFASKNALGAGNSTLVVNDGYRIEDSFGGGNYTVSTQSATGTINKAVLTLTAATATKTYDATTSSTGTVAKSGLKGTDSVSGTSQSFTSKNALGTNNSTLAVNSGYTISDGNNGNNYTVQTQTATGTINKKTIQLAAVSSSKTYDGTTSSSGTVTKTGVQGTDTVTATQSFDSKNASAANGRTLSVNSGYTINDGNNGNNYNVIFATATGTISKANLTLAAVTSTKTYDGTTTSATSVSAVGLKPNDTVTATQSFNSKNASAANGRTLSVNSGYTINDGNNGNNYTVSTQTATGTINKAVLTLSAATDTRTYNGGTNSTGAVTASGLKGTDSVSGTSQSFASKNALGTGNSSLVVNGGYTISDGNSGNNYTVQTQTATGTINKALLTLRATTDTRFYNASTSSTGIVTASGLQGSDTVAATQSFASRHVLGNGNSTLVVNGGYTISDGNGGGNYTVQTENATGTINKASLFLAAVPDTKTYDGTIHSTGTVATIGLRGGDTVTATQTFNSKNASGVNERFLFVKSDYTINDGNNGGNYAVTANAANGTINKADLILSAVADTKTYDGTTSSTATVAKIGLKGTDTVTATQSFDSKNASAANGRLLSVDTGYAINDERNGGNYNVTIQTATGTIDKATLTLAAVADTKTYDGTTASNKTVTVTGLQGSDSVSGTSQSFASKNALGTGYSSLIVGADYAVDDGNGGGNYTVTTQTATGTIDKATLTLAAVADTKTYDGTTSSTGTVTASGLQGTDTVSGTSQSFASKNALGAGNSTLSVNGGYAISDGNGGGNYTVSTQSATGTINKATLTLAAVADTKTYDGTTSSTGTVTASGLQGSDSVSGTSQSFASKNALGSGNSTLSVNGGYAISDGNSGGNYTVSTQSATGTINKATLTLAAVADTKTYDGTTSSTGTVTASGLQGTDSVSGTSQSFASKNALGAGNSTLSVNGGYAISDGNGGGNYTVTTQTATGTIDKAALTLTAVADTKTYDGTTGSKGQVAYSGLMSGDSITGLDQSFASKNAGDPGSQTLRVNEGYQIADGNGGDNYTVTRLDGAGTINRAKLTLSATTDTKTYDATTLSSGIVTASGLVDGDRVTSAQAFTSKNAKGIGGSSLTVIDGYVIDDGTGGGNYDVTLQEAQGTIEQAALTLIAATDSKTYDGQTTSTGTVTISGLIGSDRVTARQAFTSRNAAGADASTLTVLSDYAINDGNDGGNYRVTLQSAKGTITAMGIQVIADSLTKYVNSADPALTYRFGANRMIEGDSLTGTLTRAEGNVPGDYEISLGTLAASSNYSLSFVPGTLTIRPSRIVPGGLREDESTNFDILSSRRVGRAVNGLTLPVAFDDRIAVVTRSRLKARAPGQRFSLSQFNPFQYFRPSS